MKRVIVIDMAGEESCQEGVVTAAAPESRKDEMLYAPSEDLLLQTVTDEPFREKRPLYSALFEEYFKR